MFPGGEQLPYLDLIQNAFGRHNLTNVAAHVGSRAGEANRILGALAFTAGDQVAFAGQPSLHTAAHEAAHVVQQRGGVHLKGDISETGDAYERHADKVADHVTRGESVELLLDQIPSPGVATAAGGGGPVIQCKDYMLTNDPELKELKGKTPITQDENWIYLRIIYGALLAVAGIKAKLAENEWAILYSTRPRQKTHHHNKSQSQAEHVRDQQFQDASEKLLEIMNAAKEDRVPWLTPRETLETAANMWHAVLPLTFFSDLGHDDAVELAAMDVRTLRAEDLTKIERLYDHLKSRERTKLPKFRQEATRGEKGEKPGGLVGLLTSVKEWSEQPPKEWSEQPAKGIEQRAKAVEEQQLHKTHVAEKLLGWLLEAGVIAGNEQLIRHRELAELISELHPDVLDKWGQAMLKLKPHELHKIVNVGKGASKVLEGVGAGAAVVGYIMNILEGVNEYVEQKELLENLMKDEVGPMIRDCRLGRDILRKFVQTFPPFVGKNAREVGVEEPDYAFLALIEERRNGELFSANGRPGKSGLLAASENKAHAPEILAMLEAYLKHVTPTLTLLGDWYVHWNKMTMAFVAAGLDLLTVFPVVGQAAVFAGVILFFRNTLRLDEKAIHLLLSYPLTEVARLPAPHIDINLPTMLGSKILTDEWMH